MIADGGRLIYLIVDDRAKFDIINLPATEHRHANGGVVLAKAITAPVYIVFQHWIVEPSIAARATSPRTVGGADVG